MRALHGHAFFIQEIHRGRFSPDRTVPGGFPFENRNVSVSLKNYVKCILIYHVIFYTLIYSI